MLKETLMLITSIMISNVNANLCPWGNVAVCGVDYITYKNQCALAAAYVELKHFGPCNAIMTIEGELQENCSQVYEPVCGRDSVTYMNECTMKFKDVEMAFHGPCDNPDFIPHDPPVKCNCRNHPFKPVCSLGGGSYEHECVLNCIQQIHQNRGPCSTPCDCPKKYQPVCGVDGLTYDNKCALNCVKVLKQGNGECPSILKGCHYCSKVFMPVCGSNGVTFRNLCELKCNGLKFMHFGKCKDIIVKRTDCEQCSNIEMPICGSDGRNYPNECLCTCQGNCRKYSEGRCPVEQTCSRCRGVIDRVCGKNEETFDNMCFAECAGIEILHKGNCDFSFDGIQIGTQFVGSGMNYA